MQTPIDILTEKKESAKKRVHAVKEGAQYEVYVGMATCEIAAGSQAVMDVFHEAIEQGLGNTYLGQRGCAGQCYLEPTVQIVEKGKPIVRYGKIDAEKALTIIERHIKKGEIIKEWVI